MSRVAATLLGGTTVLEHAPRWFVEWMGCSQLFVLVVFEPAGSHRSISPGMSELRVRTALRDMGVDRRDIDRGLADAKTRADADSKTASPAE